jgi:hypothetical protein
MRMLRGGQRAPIVVLVLVALVAGACSSGSSGDESGNEPEEKAPAAAPARENVTFYYQQVHADRDLSRLGKVQLVVAAPQTDGAEAARLIKSTGAKAYRYLQTYWLPTTGYTDDPESTTATERFFCQEGDEPTVGRTDRQGRDWYFYDMNERAALDHLKGRLQAAKAEGWDGVFFDRGFAALTGYDDEVNTNVWDEVSSCTDDPVQEGATFADAYVGATREAHEAGLEIMMNYGVSPFDNATPLRPDSKSDACRERDFANCPRLDDVWEGIDWTLNEAIAHPQDQAFLADYEANLKNEREAKNGRRVVGLLTTASLGENNRVNVFFEWARVKLFQIPLAVNTGEGGCQGQTVSVCNRAQLYPDLANANLGEPLAQEPSKQACTGNPDVNCLWVRRYSHGMSVVNVSAEPVTATLKLGVDGCRVVTSVYDRRALEDRRCVTKVPMTIPAWSGRPLIYAAA